MFKRNQIVQANAGSGKTHSLTSRIIELLKNGADPATILATTFTKKAASQIRERLFLRLLDDQECRTKILQKLIYQQHLLKIQTIDGVFYSLAQAFSTEVGLEEGWRIGDSLETESLIRQATLATLKSLDEDEMIALILEVSQQQATRSIVSQLEDYFRNFSQYLFEAPPKKWQIDLVKYEKVSTAQFYGAIEIIKRIEINDINKSGKPNANVEKALKGVVELLSDTPLVLAEILRNSFLHHVVTQKKYYKQQFSQVELDAVKNALYYAAFQELKSYNKKTKALAYLMLAYRSNLKDLHTQTSKLSYNEVKERVAYALNNLSLDALAFRLSYRAQHLLFDEFQDTSRLEWQLFSPVTAEVLSSQDRERSFFCVGDQKQSIYQWRGGVPELLDEVIKQYQLSPEELNKSYRSAQVILDFVNTFLKACSSTFFKEYFPRVAASWQERFSQHISEKKELPGYIIVKSGEVEDIFQDVSQQIKRLIEHKPDISIAVLATKNDQVSEISEYLINQLPYGSVVGQLQGGKLSTPSLEALFSAFRLADFPDDSAARFFLASVGIYQLFEFEDLADNLSFYKLAQHFRESFFREGAVGIYKTIAPLLKPYLNQAEKRLFEVIEDWSILFNHRLGSASEFHLWVSQKLKFLDDSAAVQVMTIHRAKGLEFDAVFLPFLDEAFVEANNSHRKLLIKRQFVKRQSELSEIEMVLLQPRKEIVDNVDELKDIVEKQRDQEVSGAVSALYVALTRARQALYLWLRENSAKQKNIKKDDLIKHSCELYSLEHSKGIYQELDDQLLKETFSNDHIEL
jgi:ATP-dependent exoDNAse (exonuclease V) beta subunit